jgi:MFS family permease
MDHVFRKNVRLFIARSFILSVYTGIYDVIFNLYILDMGFHEDFLGLMLALNLLTASIASVPAGILCDRFNKRKVMIVFSLLSFLSVVPLFLTSSPAISVNSAFSLSV